MRGRKCWLGVVIGSVLSYGCGVKKNNTMQIDFEDDNELPQEILDGGSSAESVVEIEENSEDVGYHQSVKGGSTTDTLTFNGKESTTRTNSDGSIDLLTSDDSITAEDKQLLREALLKLEADDPRSVSIRRLLNKLSHQEDALSVD